ncbi:MAG TPA: hypothetical protein VJ964_03585 [Balneolaceae bacterium]|nr:hypothetical protein [Balneolaceae bacterium]
MRKYLIFFSLGLVTFVFTYGFIHLKHLPLARDTQQVNAAKNIDFARKQLRFYLNQHKDPTQFPRSVNHDGTVTLVKAGDWTSGFFPGELWYLYKQTRNYYWKKKAEAWTNSLRNQQFNTGTHDVGFMMNCSFGNGFLFSDHPQYKKVLMQSAKSLSSRFNKKVGAIKSWDSTDWQYPVIIDNMMNLELLFRATQISGDSTFYHIAKTHALSTLKHQFRPDGSSFHVVNYDTSTGRVLWQGTSQGYADSSTWARGEAWGLYGFTMAYRFTRDQRFLKQAKKIAHFILTNPNLPEDNIPFWDYDAPNIPKAPRDVSAAAIMSSAFLELSSYTDKSEQEEYTNAAEKILKNLSTPKYRARKVGANEGFILKKSVGNKPSNSEVSVPMIYADYYYLEANIRYLKMKKD